MRVEICWNQKRARDLKWELKRVWFAIAFLQLWHIFDITKQNVAAPDPRFPLGGLSVATGEQQSRGVEFDLSGEILPGWNIIASYTYTDAEVTQHNVTPIGNRLAGIPKHSFNVWTTYTIQTGSLQGLGFGVGVNYVGKREGDLDNSFQLPSYFLPDAAIFYQRDNWRFAVNFKNLFNWEWLQIFSVNHCQQ